MKVNLVSVKGIKKEDLVMPKSFDVDNASLLSQALHVYEDGSHIGTSYAKTRAEVNATGAKVWRQKGTGNARHGSRRAPIFVGGGKAHGPKGIKRVLSLPQKVKRLALLSAISVKAHDDSLVAVDSIGSLNSTKEAGQLINKVRALKNRKLSSKVTVVMNDKDKGSVRYFSNLKNVVAVFSASLNAFSVFSGGLLVFDKSYFSGDKKSVQEDSIKKPVKKAESKKVSRKKIVKK